MRLQDHLNPEQLAKLREAVNTGKPMQVDLRIPVFEWATNSWWVRNTRTGQAHRFDQRAEAQEFYDNAIQ